MNEPQSWLENSASKPTARRRIVVRIAAGLAVIAIVLGAYAYGPATAEKKAAAPEPVKVAQATVHQASVQDVQKLIPVPEPGWNGRSRARLLEVGCSQRRNIGRLRFGNERLNFLVVVGGCRGLYVGGGERRDVRGLGHRTELLHNLHRD